MSREIKFRVYDHEHKTMGRVIDWSRYELMEDVGNVVYYVGDKTSLQPTDSEMIAIMQYTGIKDKNGVEVYDGDIVVAQTVERSPFSPDYVSGHLKGVIVYYGNSFCILSGGIYYPHWTNAEEIEVIGNIHENKDLLQDVEG